MEQVKVKVRPGRVVNGQKEGTIMSVSPEQAVKLVQQNAVSRVDPVVEAKPPKKD